MSELRSNKNKNLWKWEHYFDIYERHLSPLRSRQVNVLEIGVLDGGSLKMWQRYFNDPMYRHVGGFPSYIDGLDINPECQQFSGDGIRVHIGDQSNEEFMRELAKNGYDIVIDDGSHIGAHQVTSFRALYPLLKPGGVYVVEDMEPNAFMQHLQSIMWHLQPHSLDQSPNRVSTKASVTQQRVSSVHVYPGIVVIEKPERAPELFFAERR